MRTFVINLDRSLDRLAFITREAAAIGLAFERIPAVDGRSLPPDLRSQFLDESGNPLSRLVDGEIGCYASHLTIHQRILAEGLPCALVLEDDVRLMPRLMETAQAAAAAAPEGWDFIHLSSVLNRAVYAIAELPGGRNLIRHVRPPRSVAGYVISRSGAAKMLTPAPRTRPVDMDIKLAHERDLDILGVYPSPVIWGNHLPSAIWANHQSSTVGWTAPERQGNPRLPALRGHLYTARKLGFTAYIQCRLASLRFGLERRFGGRSRDGIPIVKSITYRRG